MNTFAQTLLHALPRPTAVAPRTAVTSRLSNIRHESSSRRMTKRLQLPPHNSFKLTASSPTTSHIVYNPPAASPSVYFTPSLFLPKGDPRRVLLKPSAEEQKQSAKLPPPLKPPREKTYHLTPADFAEMRRLRDSEPDVWTRVKLAEKFGTSPFFVGMVCQASDERKTEMQGRLATIKSKWGKNKTTARLDRKRRKVGWGGADGL